MTHATLLLAVDHDDPVDALARTATTWSDDGDRLVAVGVAPELLATVKSAAASSAARKAEEMMLAEVKTRVELLKRTVGERMESHLISGRIADEVVKAAVLYGADIVVKTADRPTEDGASLFGSVEKSLIRKCPKPVWIVRPDRDAPPRRIAVAVENAETASRRREAEGVSRALLAHAAELARRFSIEKATVIHAWNATGAPLLDNTGGGLSPEAVKACMDEWEAESAAWLAGFVDAANAEFGGNDFRFEGRLVSGRPARAVADAATDLETDVLVIGSANRTGVAGLLIGNTAEAVIHHAPCSLFVVKPEGAAALLEAA